MHIALADIFSLILHYKYWILFPLLVVEGPVVTIIAAFLASPAYHQINLIFLFPEVVIADLFGDVFYYCVGRFGGTRAVSRWGRALGISPERFKKLEEHFENHGGKTIAAGKIGHGIGWMAMMIAGMTRMYFLKFISINFLTSLVKSAVLVFIGYYYGESYQSLSNYIHYGGLIMSVVLIGAVLLFVMVRKKKS